ncbi:MAG: DUF6785 family protein [Armatimonadota bacterium]
MATESSTIEAALRPRPLLGLSARAVVLGLVLIPVNAWWITQIEYVRYSDNATTGALFFNCVGMLLILAALNALARRVRPNWAFHRTELLTVYVILVISSCLGGHDQLQILFTTLTYVFHGADPANRWAEDIHPLLPDHLLVADPDVLDPLYLGGASFYTRMRFFTWLPVLGWWIAFTMIIAWVMLCLSAAVRRQWDAERLNYPIAEVPLLVTSPTRHLFRQWQMWVGAVLAASLQMLNLASSLNPAVPTVPIGVRYYHATSRPWTAAGSIPISSFPFAYGLAYLLPLHLAFSCWFFFWLVRVEMVLADALGRFHWGGFPYVQQQGFGAYLAFCAFMFWVARHRIARVLRLGPSAAEDAREPLPMRVALVGALAGGLALVVFASAAGMRPLSAACFFVLVFAVVLVTARLRAELGLPTIELYQVGAEDAMQRVAGGAAWTGKDLTVMSLFFFLTRTHRQFPMQNYVDALRMGKRTHMRLRPLAVLLLLATLVSIAAAFWAYLHVMYQVGYESATFTGPAIWAFGRAPWAKLGSWLAEPRQPDLGSTIAYSLGFVLMLVLTALRVRFLGWPLHPVGYLVSGSFGLFRLWLPIFFTWLVKMLLLRYGGLRAYRKGMPFFVGLILGEFLAGFLRTVIDLIFDLHLPATAGIGGL